MKLTVAAVAISSVLAGVAGWTANGWRYEAHISEINAAHCQALAAANAAALARYSSMEQKKNEAILEANRKAQANARAAAGARNELERLRHQVSATASALSTANCPSTRIYATTLSTVFAECAGRLEALAKDADGHAVDSRALSEAWPR